ncbi:transmembrane protein 107-like [Dendronephthya gigantea]|uniref:transmembrane protein 107-like n=1 Tax=Dendronephthya gigantea TaxID=151771 RepID=UPI00106D2A76|nr:transmembrane protein 107-like [Dendronephthya gigantea]
MSVGSLIPVRFLTLTAHLVITIVIFWSKDANLLECLPLSYSQKEYDDKDTTLVIGLSLMLAFLGIELLSFLGGVSMFNASASMFSIAAHGIGTISLSFFIFDSWDCDRFWYIFGFCSAFPVLIEIIVMVAVS